MTKIVVCGGGNGGHVAAVLATVNGGDVRLLSRSDDRAKRIRAGAEANGGFIRATFTDNKGVTSELRASPNVITNDPHEAAKGGIDIVLLVVPAFAHAGYLSGLRQYITPGTVVVGAPGSPGFPFEVDDVLGSELSSSVTLLDFVSLPWLCRMVDFGKHVEVLGTKESLRGSIRKGAVAPKVDPIPSLQQLLGKNPVMTTCGHMIGVTLGSVNQIIHTSVMYGQWANWDGQGLKESPLLYHSISDTTGNLLNSMSAEICTLAKKICDMKGVDLRSAQHVYDYYLESFGKRIENRTTTANIIRCNPCYNDLRHPTVVGEDGLHRPNFSHRFMNEDLPFGLVVTRGIAEIFGIPTPNIDMVLYWCQKQMGREFLVDGKLTGRDLGITRAPQRYGLNTIDQVMGNCQ